jgi:hypothetical protein
MPTSTYEPIGTYTVTGSNLLGTTGVTFTSFSGYTDLILVQSVNATAPAIGCIQVNGDTGSNYSQTSLSGSGSGSGTSSRASNAGQWNTVVAHLNTTWSTYISQFQNYSNTTTYKTSLHRNNDLAFGTEAVVGLWRNTAAITSIKAYMDRAEYYVVGSTFTLYGIKAA